MDCRPCSQPRHTRAKTHIFPQSRPTRGPRRDYWTNGAVYSWMMGNSLKCSTITTNVPMSKRYHNNRQHWPQWCGKGRGHLIVLKDPLLLRQLLLHPIACCWCQEDSCPTWRWNAWRGNEDDDYDDDDDDDGMIMMRLTMILWRRGSTHIMKCSDTNANMHTYHHQLTTNPSE